MSPAEQPRGEYAGVREGAERVRQLVVAPHLGRFLLLFGCVAVLVRERSLRRRAEVHAEEKDLENERLGLRTRELEEELNAERRLTSQDDCTPWSTWRISEGDDCIIDEQGCVQTVGFPVDNYANQGSCNVEFETGVDLMLLFQAFNVEDGWDFLYIDSTSYTGHTVPKPVRVTGDTVVSWRADASVPNAGWRACLRSPCTSLSCPAGFTYKEDQTCGEMNCTDADIPACCEPIIGCGLPDVLNDTYTVPDACLVGNNHTVQSCTIGCAGYAVLNGWKLPQTCDVDSKVFTLPSCEVQPKTFPWNFTGPCQTYGTGCISSANVGGRYGSDEACVISAKSETDLSAYQFWLTYLHTEPVLDTLSVDNPIAPGTYCDGIDYWYVLCYYFVSVRPDDEPFSGDLLTHGKPGQAIGPLPFKKTISWTTDAATQATGFIVCAQAQCSTMTCPSGYRFKCEAQLAWCVRHDCSLEQDVESCCMSETSEFLSTFDLQAGDAADVTICSWLALVSTTTTTTLLPDYVGELHLELNENYRGSANASAEIAVATVQGSLQKLALVQSDAVRIAWEEQQHANRSMLRVAFRVQASGVDLELLSSEAILDEMNTNVTHFDAVLLRTSVRVAAADDINGFRPYGSLCKDLYDCTDVEACWREHGTGQSCGQLHAGQWCTSDPSEPGRGFYEHHAGETGYAQLWSSWTSASSDADVGSELATEVCCTCGGGQCSPGTSRSLVGAASLCLPCLPGTTSAGESCTNCAVGRYSDVAAAQACKACPAGRYGDEEGLQSCALCAKGATSTQDAATACVACQPGKYTNDHISCDSCLPGTYAAGNSSSRCEYCPPGHFMDEAGASACTACSEGTFSTGGRTACDSCPAGMEALTEGASECDRCDPGFAKAAGQMNCTECTPGTYSAEPGLTACRPCPLGAYTNSPQAATGCQSCSVGRFASSEGLTECDECALGRYAPESDATECINCATGDFANTTGLSWCLTCSPGSYTHMVGESQCTECSPGREAPLPGAEECEICIPGTYADGNGMSRCLACPAGAFTPLGGQTSCVMCQTGRFAGSPSRSECLLCEPGSYANEVGMTGCTACHETLPGLSEHWTTMSPPTPGQSGPGAGNASEVALVTEVGASIATSPSNEPWTELRGAVSKVFCGCKPGTQPVGNVCEICGEGLICLGMGVLRIEDGYAWDSKRSVWDCRHGVEDACPGGEPGRCSYGRDEESIACALCVDKFVPLSDGSCTQCKDADYLVPSFVAILGVGVVVVCYCIFDRANRKRPKLSFLLIVASMGQFVTIIQQLGVISLIRVDWSNPLLSAFDIVSAVAFFDVQVLRPSCLFVMGVVTLYSLRVGAVFIVLAVICLAHLLSQLLQHRQSWRTRWPSLCCALGTVVLTFFVTIVSTMLGPMQCRKHPNDRKTVSWYPSVACWEGGDHATMIILGASACLLPVLFLVACVIAVRRFPRSLLHAETSFLNRWAFLFFRYTNEAYWYGPVMLVRNTLVSACPVIYSPAMQILSLEIVMLSSLFVLLTVMPWRVRLANYLDGFGHVCLLMVTMMASFFVDDDDDTSFISTAGFVFICAVPLMVMAVLVSGIVALCQSLKKPYQFFLCHHKLGAGCFCRLLKMWLSRSIRRKVFIDTDDLTNLDRLFDVVAHETETFVAVHSKNLLQRPWCVGEITTAHRSHLRLTHISMPGVEVPQEDFIENFLQYVQDISCLTQFGIDVTMIQDALRWLASSDVMEPPQELDDNAMDTLCSHMLTMRRSSSSATRSTLALPVPPRDKAPVKEVIIICNQLDHEASSSALILWALYNPIVQHKENAFAGVLALDQEAPSTVKKAMLICTNGVFTGRVLEALFVCEDAGAAVLPIMNVTNFVFPSARGMQEQGLFQNMDITKQQRAMSMVQAIFQEIGVDFQPSALSGTEATLRIKAQEIAERLLRHPHRSHDARSRGKDSSPKDWSPVTSTTSGMGAKPSLRGLAAHPHPRWIDEF